MCVHAHAQSLQTLCDLMNYSLPGSSVHGLFQARIPGSVAISYPGRSFQDKDENCVSCLFHWQAHFLPLHHLTAPLMAQLVKNPPAMRETWVRSLRWEDHLKKGKTTHSTMLAWSMPWTVACQALLTMGSTGKNTGVSCHFFLPDPGIQPMSPALAGDSLPLRQVGSPQVLPR